MIPIITNLINWFSKNNKLLAVIIITIFSAIFVFQHNQLNNKQKEIDRLYNNCLYYQSISDSTIQNNRVLQLTLDDISNSNDSLVKEIELQRKQLNIKKKEVQQATMQSQTINVDTTIIVHNDDFTIDIKPNELTSILISRKDSILSAKLEINNSQTIFITQKKEYKRKYKNWLTRLIHLDFKKINSRQYQIVNSNDLIKTKDVRIIEINK